MTSKEWDLVYSTKQMAQYPDTELVRFVARNYYNVPDRKEVKFLDVGCGAGASTWYLAREGFSVAAIDGSIVAVTRLKARLEGDKLEAMLACADITKLEFKSDYFDCVIDVSSLCYVPDDDILSVMENIYRVLKPGGKLFSLTPMIGCPKEPYNHTVEGVDLKARFLQAEHLEYLYSHLPFVNVKIGSYRYGLDPQIALWETQAEKSQ